MSEKEALLKLLEDEDPKIATIAIGKLLQYGPDIFPALRGLQESANPLLRKRVHQIEAILEKKINFSNFIDRIEKDEILIWEDLIYLNSIYYPDLKPSELQSSMEEAYKNLSAAEFNTKSLCNYMKDKNYYVPKNDILDSGINLISSVLINGEGSPLMLCIISQLWGTRFSWPFQIVLHKGHHCLIDKNKMLIEPANNWKCSLIDEKIKAIENFDKLVVGPIVDGMGRFGEFRVMVLPDHLTPISVRTHVADPVPYVVCGTDIVPNGASCYSEAEAQKSGIIIENGYELLPSYLKR